jgi:hypothetical protein
MTFLPDVLSSQKVLSPENQVRLKAWLTTRKIATESLCTDLINGLKYIDDNNKGIIDVHQSRVLKMAQEYLKPKDLIVHEDPRMNIVINALMNVCARPPRGVLPEGDEREFPVLSLDPDYMDLPADHTEGTEDDDITQEAVQRLAKAVIDVLDQWNIEQAVKAVVLKKPA